MDKTTSLSPGMVCRALDNEAEFVTVMHTDAVSGPQYVKPHTVIFYVTGDRGKNGKRVRKQSCFNCTEADFLKMYTPEW